MRPGGTGTGGFTLLEILAALAVLGLLLVMLAQGVQFGLQASQAQDMFEARHSHLEAVDRTLRRLITQAHPGFYPEPATLHGTASTISFTTVLPAARPGGTVQADAVLTNEAGRLLLLWTPRLRAELFRPAAAQEATVILDGVERAEFSYSAGGPWLSAWKAERLPKLVRLSITIRDGSGRYWPPIIAAPAAEPIEQ